MSSVVDPYSPTFNSNTSEKVDNKFREDFKRYKAKDKCPDLGDVIDIRRPNGGWGVVECQLDATASTSIQLKQLASSCGLHAPSDWKCYSIKDKPGLYILSDVFSSNQHQVELATQFLTECPTVTDNRSNLDISMTREERSTKIASITSASDPLLSQLRWTTLGYQYDWTEKVYNEHNWAPFPKYLSDICECVVKAVMGDEQYRAQAAIVNYYPPGATLSAHVDHSEWDNSLPLVSISLGLPAIYLTGGPCLSERPSALVIRSGDVLIMSGDQRLVYHAVPRIISKPDELTYFGFENFAIDTNYPCDSANNSWITDYLNRFRINVSVRQMQR